MGLNAVGSLQERCLFTISKRKCHGLSCSDNHFQGRKLVVSELKTSKTIGRPQLCSVSHAFGRAFTLSHTPRRCVCTHKSMCCASHRIWTDKMREKTFLIIYRFSLYPRLISKAIFISSCSLLFGCCSFMDSKLQFTAICCQPNS